VPSVVALGLVLALQFVAVGLGVGSIAACSESSSLATTGETACEVVTSSTLSWFVAVLWPSALFAATQLVPWARRHSLPIAIATTFLTILFWAYVFTTA
jgi:hypothetical protein